MTWRVVGTAVVLLLAACGGDDDAVDAGGTDDPAITSSILVASGSKIIRVDGDDVEIVGEVDGDAAVAYGAGVDDTQAVEVGGKLIAMVDGEPTPLDPGAPGEVRLLDAVLVDGVPHALYAVYDGDATSESKGPLILGSIVDDDRRELGTAYAPEYGVWSGSIGGGLLAISAISDLTESVTIAPLGGDGEPNPWSPTTDLPYNAPPFVSDAMLAPDGDTVAWLAGPDVDGSSGDGDTRVGSWEVVVADLDGDELHRLALDATPEPTHLDYDGDRLLVSRDGAAAVLVDLASGVRHELPVIGTATFDG